MKTKSCTICHAEKSFSDFHKGAGKKDGLKYHCKKCASLLNKEYYFKNSKRIAVSQRAYYRARKKINDKIS